MPTKKVSASRNADEPVVSTMTTPATTTDSQPAASTVVTDSETQDSKVVSSSEEVSTAVSANTASTASVSASANAPTSSSVASAPRSSGFMPRITRHKVARNFSHDRFDERGERSSDKSNDRDRSHEESSEMIEGILDLSRDGHGVLRASFAESDRDAYISTSQIRRLQLRPGDVISGPARRPKENERFYGLLKVDRVNGMTLEEYQKKERVKFKSLTPVYPDSQIKLETGKEPLSLRIIDMIAPIGKGQRSLIVSPPKAGKTTLLKDIATGVAANNPDIHLMAVLVGERPEEVTDIRRHIDQLTKGKGEVAASNFDEPATDQCRVAELALERAKRLVEAGRDVVILLDSITRLARAYNLAMPTSGRTLSGGFDPAALFPPKKFFGAARNFEVQGSLTIVGTALVDTGSRMDDLVYEEFKGTGNQEVHLDRSLAERRVHPAIDVQKSGTRRDDLLIEPMTYQSIITLHRMLDMLNKDERTITLIEKLKRSDSNKEFLASLKG
jgi:transcription termination factor Rho